MYPSSSQSLYGILRRPLVRIILFCLVLVFLFVALVPHTDAAIHFFDDISLVPSQHQRPPIPPHPEGPPRHRIKVQRPLAGTIAAHDGPWAQRADAVRGAFLHAYKGYLAHAAPHDELLPLSKGHVDKCVCPLPRAAAALVD